MKICVFCSSSDRVSPMVLSECERLGEVLAEDGHTVVYGGATPGCMGALARGVIRRGGKLVGVVPQMDFMDNIVEPRLSERHVVPTLSSRKTVMLELADAFIVYPGGLGTLDEALEAMALKSLGTLDKPILFYNFLDIWSPILEALELLREQHLIRDAISDLAVSVDKLEDLREHFKHAIRAPR
jgi:uncharacterized protein (TIGR00730 family)